MRCHLIANWKMNLSEREVLDFITSLRSNLDLFTPSCNYGIAPSLLHLQILSHLLPESNCEVIAQRASPRNNGSFTGFVGYQQLLADGIKTVFVGHSEVRELFHETEADINDQVQRFIGSGLKVILCFGETLSDLDRGEHYQVLHRQLQTALMGLKKEQLHLLRLAYEPVWAIGTGKSATPATIRLYVDFFKEQLMKMFGESGTTIPILYGGSVSSQNLGLILETAKVNGVLVGKSSLNPDSFFELLKITSNFAKQAKS